MKATKNEKYEELYKDHERKKLQRLNRRQQVMRFLISLQSDPEDFVLHSLGEFVYLEICKKIM